MLVLEGIIPTGPTVPAIKNAPVNKNAPLFSSIYRYVPKGLEVFSFQVLSSFMFGLQDLEKKTLKM
jgi:hypothetical protein